MKRRRIRMTYREMAVAFVILTVLALIALPMFGRARESARRATCQNNLKQMGIVFKMFSGESRGGVWPPISPLPGNWIPDMNAVYPEYLSDLAMLVCPDSPFVTPGVFRIGHRPSAPMAPQCVSSLFYTYTGFMVQRDEEAVALVDAYYGESYTRFAEGNLNARIPVWAEAEGPQESTAYGQSSVPVLWDRIPLYEEEFAHQPLGANVLHMDGHVEFVPYSYYNPPGFFPVTRISAELFGSAMPRMPGECL